MIHIRSKWPLIPNGGSLNVATRRHRPALIEEVIWTSVTSSRSGPMHLVKVGLSRRSFLRATALIGMGGAAAAFLAACGNASAPTAAATAAAAASEPRSSAAPQLRQLRAASGSSAAPTAAATAAATAANGQKDIIFMRSGTGVVTGHPFIAMVDEYNRTHPNVEVKLEMYPWSNDAAPLATTLASGNPPDITRQSIPGVAGCRAAVPASDGHRAVPDARRDRRLWQGHPRTTDDQRQSRCSGRRIVTGARCWSPTATMLASAGIDVAGIQKNGWTFDEFRAAAKKLTTGGVYGYGFSNDYASESCWSSAGGPEFPTAIANMGAYLWGNKFDLTGPAAVKAMQLLHDMIYVDKSIPAEVTGLKEHMPLLWSGKVAMINYWHGAVGELQGLQQRDRRGRGDRAPRPTSTSSCCPGHTTPPGGATSTSRGRPGWRSSSRTPYKGDAHTANVVDLVRYLTSPDQPRGVRELGRHHSGQELGISVLHAARRTRRSPGGSPYAKAHGDRHLPLRASTAFGPVWGDGMNASYTAMLNNEKQPRSGCGGMDGASDAILAKWVTDNPDLAKNWATPPAGLAGEHVQAARGRKLVGTRCRHRKPAATSSAGFRRFAFRLDPAASTGDVPMTADPTRPRSVRYRRGRGGCCAESLQHRAYNEYFWAYIFLCPAIVAFVALPDLSGDPVVIYSLQSFTVLRLDRPWVGLAQLPDAPHRPNLVDGDRQHRRVHDRDGPVHDRHGAADRIAPDAAEQSGCRRSSRRSSTCPA